MLTRFPAVLAFLVALLLSTGVLAQPGNAGGNGNGGGNDNSESEGQNSGSGNGNGSGSGGGNAGGGGGNAGGGGGNAGGGGGNAGGGGGNAGGGGGNSGGSNAGGGGNTGGNGAPGGNGSGNSGGQPAGNAGSGAGQPGATPAEPANLAPSATPPAGSPERRALDARQSGAAVALEDLLPAVREEGAEVLDAQLLTISGTLVYELKVLSRDGTLSTRYFFARTGQAIEGR